MVQKGGKKKKRKKSKEIREYVQLNENKNTTCQNLWDAAKKVMLTGKYIAFMTYIRKE